MWSDAWVNEHLQTIVLELYIWSKLTKYACVSKNVLLSGEALSLTQGYIENVLTWPAISLVLLAFLIISRAPCPQGYFLKRKRERGREAGREGERERNQSYLTSKFTLELQ